MCFGGGGTEPRILHMLDKRSAAKLYTCPLINFVLHFWTGSPHIAQAGPELIVILSLTQCPGDHRCDLLYLGSPQCFD